MIYEAHVRGFTLRNEKIPFEERGTYKALGHPSTIEYLTRLGVTALELLPIHHSVSEVAINARGRINYWGYNPIAFSAPHRTYAATDDPIRELQDSIDALHSAGIEVILDVVYNHTAEEGKSGPTYSFRGIDNKTFYRSVVDDFYEDVTGCGNTLDTRRPFVTRMIIDSLHWWSQVIGVDGFRFDLTTALARGSNGIDPHGALISAIAADPILRERKIIAEPWDVAGYALGDFPHPWREWNDAYRDALRQFWLADSARGHSNGLSDLASRLAGSHDIFYFRGPSSSINFVTSLFLRKACSSTAIGKKPWLAKACRSFLPLMDSHCAHWRWLIAQMSTAPWTLRERVMNLAHGPVGHLPNVKKCCTGLQA